MIKLLIADDETFVLETISTMIDWNSIGINLVGKARNGIEAYNMILDLYPDIVLTDIKMPGLSGLELIKKISEINSDTQFIILSGFGEFDYAKEAMRYGVTQYLLKPCNEEQIVNAINEVKKHIALHNIDSSNFKQENLTDLPISIQIKQYVEQHLFSPTLSLKYIGDNIMFMNVDYLSRCFVKETGTRFSTYLTNQRIAHAKELIKNNPYSSVADIAEKVGCGNNPQYFSQIFKKEVGMPPTKYMKQYK